MIFDIKIAIFFNFWFFFSKLLQFKVLPQFFRNADSVVAAQRVVVLDALLAQVDDLASFQFIPLFQNCTF